MRRIPPNLLGIRGFLVKVIFGVKNASDFFRSEKLVFAPCLSGFAGKSSIFVGDHLSGLVKVADLLVSNFFANFASWWVFKWAVPFVVTGRGSCVYLVGGDLTWHPRLARCAYLGVAAVAFR